MIPVTGFLHVRLTMGYGWKNLSLPYCLNFATKNVMEAADVAVNVATFRKCNYYCQCSLISPLFSIYMPTFRSNIISRKKAFYSYKFRIMFYKIPVCRELPYPVKMIKSNMKS